MFVEVKRQIANAELIFASDVAGFPYGIRSEADLIGRVDKVLSTLIEIVAPDLAIIACNSASTVVLPVIRSKFDLPFIGVVPAVKPAAERSVSRSIGLIATPATVSRPYTRQLIDEFAKGCEVQMLGSSELVYLAEKKLRGEPVDINRVAEIISPLFSSTHGDTMDTVVLACTHFPLLRDELEKAAPRQVQWIDSADAIARRAISLLGNDSEQHEPESDHQAIFTGSSEINPTLIQTLQSMGISRILNMDV